MSGPDAEALLASPVGRAVLAELVGLDPEELGGPVSGVRLTPAGTTRAGRQSSEQTTPRTQPPPTSPPQNGTPESRPAAEIIAAAVAAADLGELARCRDRLALLSAVAAVIDGRQGAVGAQLAAARDALSPVAAALTAAPAAAWWWEPAARSSQRWVGAEGLAPPRGSALVSSLRQSAAADEAEEEAARQALAAPRRLFRPRRARRASGSWWSAPLGGTVFTTTGPLDGLPAVELACAEDNAGEELMEVWAIEIAAGARVREINHLADWGQLAAEYPRDVTASRGYDWDEWTGPEGPKGPWIQPDWPAVSRDWDGVHLSVGGYLNAAWLPVAAGDRWALLAGWGADWTLWLSDVFAGVEHVRSWRGTPGGEAIPRARFPWLPPGAPADQGTGGLAK